MTTVFKLNMLVIAATLLLFSAFTTGLAQNSYNAELKLLLEKLETGARRAPALQLAYYQRDEKMLTQFLADTSTESAILLASAYDNQGQTLASAGDSQYGAATFEVVRAPFLTAQTGLLAVNAQQKQIGITVWSALTDNSALIHLSIPVFTTVDPTLKNLAALDFLQTPSRSDNSLRVIGYLHYTLSPAGLLASIQAQIGPVITVLGILSLLVCILAVLIMRRVAGPLARLVVLAENILAGNPPGDLDIGGGRDFKDMPRLLELTLGGVDKHKQEANIGAKLATLTAEERASQLSIRNEELHKAEAVISKAKRRLRQMTYYDSLTSLPNRRLLTEQLSLLLKLNARNNHSLGLLLINLDNFKRFNESIGRSASDQLLKEVGKRLGNCLRDSDLLAQSQKPGKNNIDISRLDGDEFVVVLNQLERPQKAELVAERMIEALKEPFHIGEHAPIVAASIGIALAPRNAQNVDNLLKAASSAMHHAQLSSRAFLTYHDGIAAADVSHPVSLGADLLKAMKSNQLDLLYQPQVDTVSGIVVGTEAVVSWNHPEFGHVEPNKIISTAEEIGCINELGDWVLMEACSQMKAFIVSGVKLPRATIKISSLQLGTAFVQRLKTILMDSGLPPEKLELGLPEAALMNKHNDIGETVTLLQATGIRLCVTDFGTSGAALNYLGQFSLNAIQLTQSFVADCDSRPESARLVVAMLAMAKALDLEVLTAGVETESQCQCLVDSGARIQQGDFFSKPVAAPELKPLLVPWHFMEQVQHIGTD
jgi:diguanylate cyclase (GGDEF)-like protein